MYNSLNDKNETTQQIILKRMSTLIPRQKVIYILTILDIEVRKKAQNNLKLETL